MLKALWFLFRIELRLLLRRSQEWLYPLVFFLIVMTLFPIALSPQPQFLEKFIPGCVWIAALLASLLSIENIFFTDIEEGYLEQLLLSDISLALLILIKLSAQWLVTAVPLILLTPLLGVLFHLNLSVMFVLCVSLLVGTPILILIGSLGVALTLGLQQQGVLLGLLILPLLTPVLILGINIVLQMQAGLSILGPLAFLSGLCFLAITFLPWTIACTLRISLDD